MRWQLADGTAERACYVRKVAGTLPCAVRQHDAYADNQFPNAKNDAIR